MITVGHVGDDSYVFFGTSADPFPTTVAGGLPIPIGSNLYLTDTNDQFKWTGTAWYNFAQDVEQDPVYGSLIVSLDSSVQQNTAVLKQLLAAQQYSNMLLSASTNMPSDDHVSSTLMQ